MTGHISALVLVTLTSSLILITLWWRRKTKQDILKSLVWIKVGYLEEIMCYPIKSCGMLKLQDCECTLFGLRKNYVGDRSFMLVDEAGRVITSKICPKIAGIKPVLDVGGITLTASNMDYNVFINVRKLLNEARLKERLWNQELQSLDCGDDAAKWLTRCVSDGLDAGLRLMFLPQKHLLQSRSPHPKYWLVTDASMKYLTAHLPYRFTPQHLRANFVITQCQNNVQFSSNLIRIGSTIFTNVKHHHRLPTFNHQKLQNSRHTMVSSVIHLDVHHPGSVAIGDFVYVNEK